jgi:uncharacterized coiled-coil DUF342 family protein
MPEKQAYIQKHEAQMGKWEAKLDELKATAAEASADFRIEYQKQVENLQSKMSAQREKLREVSQAGEDAWEELKKGFDTTWKDLEATWDRVVSTAK